MAGTYVVMSGHPFSDVGCRGDRVMCLPPLMVAPGRATRYGVSLVSGALASRCTKVIRVDYCVIVNCRNYEYITGCDIYMCCSMEL